MGYGFPIVSSTNQNIKTKRSTETEIMGVDHFMQAICWNRYFIATQWYNTRYNRLHHDNKSSIILEGNGKASSIKITKHIIIWYLFITNSVINGKVSVVWCPTGDIIRKMTKPVQGAMFSKFRDQIMGVIMDSDMVSGKIKVEQISKSYVSIISMVLQVNDGTTGVCWGKLKISWNNGYQTYQAVTNMVT